MRKVLSLLGVFILVLSMAVPAFAAGSVTYDGDAQNFIFAPGSVMSPTSLFGNFQSVLPGATLTDQIEIKNGTIFKKVNIKVYLRSLGAQDGTGDLLSQMNLKITEGSGSVLFDAPADQTAQLTDWVYLGMVKPGGKTTLDLELQVPVTIDNKYQGKTAYLDWEFKVEEIPIKGAPATGDTANVIFYGGILLLSATALLILLIARKRKEKEEQ